YPALIGAGLSPVVATASNLLALIPGNFLASLYDRKQLPPLDRAFVGLLLSSLAAAGFGALLLMVTPERLFAGLVPALLGFATVLFAYAGRISDWLRRRAAQRAAQSPDAKQHWGGIAVALLPVSIYTGYFGAGAGVMLLAVLSIGTRGDYRSANVTKNLVTSLNSLVAAVIFIAQGKVAWPATLTMMAGALVGGVLGAGVAAGVPREIMGAGVVVMGAAATPNLARRDWFQRRRVGKGAQGGAAPPHGFQRCAACPPGFLFPRLPPLARRDRNSHM